MDATLDALHNSLQAQRRHILDMCVGLSDSDWHRSALPSGWTVLQLIHHLAADDERFWFRCVIANEPEAWASYPEDSGSFWSVPPHLFTPHEVIALYREEIGRSDAIIADLHCEDAPAALPEGFPMHVPDVRALMLHVITETACHAGHLDAMRELLDGRTYFD